jgi:TolB-like protein/Tfp pilus assembly protein PilF
MDSSTGEKTPSGGKEKSFFREFLDKLRKRHIIETLAAFIGGGWLILEFVDRLLVAHYHFPDETIDLTFITILAALICTILWRWFRGTEKRPGNVKVEVLLVPLIILTAVCIDLNILFDIAGISGKRLLIGIIALCLGIAWIIFKSLQWAAITPESSKKEAQALQPAMSGAVKSLESKNSIAVLPFVDMSPQKDQEYFCDGMTEELINRLSNIKELRVPARTSAFMFKGKAEDIREIGRKLDVRTVLEGSIRKAGNQLRVTAQLVNIADGFHLWSETYDRELKDVFNTWDEIALTIADKLKLTLLGDEKAKLTKRYTENIEPYNLYLKGRWFWNKWTEADIRKGMEYFQAAIDIDPNYALAYAGLAVAYNTLSHYSIVRPEETFPKAKELALKALSLDETLAEAHTVMGYVMVYYDWDWESGEREFKTAIAFKPDDVTAHHLYAYFLFIMNRYEEAFSEIRKALAVDPLNLITNRTLGDFHYYSGQYDRAIESLKKTIEMDPTFSYAHSYLGLAYLQKSMYPEAIAELQKDLELQRALHPLFLAFMGVAQFKGGHDEKGKDILNSLLARSQKEYVPPYFFSFLYFAMEDKDQGFNYLNKAYQERDVWLPLLAIDHFFDAVRSDRRFKDLLRRMDFPG